MANRKRSLAREARWRELVRRQPGSGLSVRAFCSREHVTESAFYAWRREIGVRDREGTPTRPAFMPVVMSPVAAADGDGHIIIDLRGGRVLRVPVTLPTARVTELVGAIEAAS
jgi:hypothetical protein